MKEVSLQVVPVEFGKEVGVLEPQMGWIAPHVLFETALEKNKHPCLYLWCIQLGSTTYS